MNIPREAIMQSTVQAETVTVPRSLLFVPGDSE